MGLWRPETRVGVEKQDQQHKRLGGKADRSRSPGVAKTALPSGSKALGLHQPTPHDIAGKHAKAVELRKAAFSFVPGFMGVLKTQKDGPLSESNQGARRLVVTDLAGVFLRGLVSAVVRFAFDAPMPPPDG